jgi:hypothetical protein
VLGQLVDLDAAVEEVAVDAVDVADGGRGRDDTFQALAHGGSLSFQAYEDRG